MSWLMCVYSPARRPERMAVIAASSLKSALDGRFPAEAACKSKGPDGGWFLVENPVALLLAHFPEVSAGMGEYLLVAPMFFSCCQM